MRRVLLFFAAVAVAVACEESGNSSSTDYAPMLRGVVDHVVVPENATFSEKADDLVTSARALETAPDAAALAKTQTAWREARAAYRKLDAVHFGPVADLAIGERIDVDAKPADIDAIIAGSAAIDAASVANAPPATKGFLGAEYLLFSAQLNDRGRTLVRVICEEIAKSAHDLRDAWANGFASEVTNAGSGSKRYATQRAAVDDVVGGVGYGFEVVVGLRLARPLGKRGTGTPDPSQDPTRASDNAVADMTATMRGVSAVYQVDDVAALVKKRSASLDTQVAREIADCSVKITLIPPPFATAVMSNTAVVESAYDACKEAKLTWNAEVTSALGATLKPSDNDGD